MSYCTPPLSTLAAFDPETPQGEELVKMDTDQPAIHPQAAASAEDRAAHQEGKLGAGLLLFEGGSPKPVMPPDHPEAGPVAKAWALARRR